MNNLKIRDRIVLLVSLSWAVVLGIIFVVIFLLSEQNRKQQFYQRLKDKTTTTLKLLVEVKGIDADLLQTFDKNTINSLYDEKILIFNEHGRLIYSGIDDAKVPYSKSIFNDLLGDKTYIESTDGKYEVLGIEFKHEGVPYYGIAKAYDRSGKNKIGYLLNVLIITYIISILIVLVITFLISRKVSQPIDQLTRQMEQISADNLSTRLPMNSNKDEMGFLVQKFNELLDRLESTFLFQKNFIQTISHELKTPLAIMLTNAERSLTEDNPDQWKESLEFQRSTTMELAHIINVLIDMAKLESNGAIQLNEQIRVDELIFECMEEIGYLSPTANFNCVLNEEIHSEHQLTIEGNKRMLKLAFLNLLKNAINYSGKDKATIEISSMGQMVKVRIENEGQLIEENDRSHLFIDIYRGKNSQSRKGLGLGLFLTNKIIALHHGDIYYKIGEADTNVFTVQFPTARY